MNHLFAGIGVSDLDGAREWWERLIGRPPDLIPNDNEAAWQLTDGGWIYLIGDLRRAGKALVTVLVDDLDAELARLGQLGIEVGEVEDLPGLVRKTMITDPDGNEIQFGQPYSR
jgi:catechol 2,3-dioxygenase-like lactoylglutathione lyase family enzyme